MPWTGKLEFVLIQLQDREKCLHVFEVYQNRKMGPLPFVIPLIRIFYPEVLAKLLHYHHRKHGLIFLAGVRKIYCHLYF